MNKERTALATAFVALASFHKHAFSPTQKTWAMEAAGVCLWALDIPEHSGIKACQPRGETIDVDPTLAITNGEKE